MFTGFSNYSFFSYRPIQAEGGTVSDILVDGRPYRVHKFTTTGNSSFTIRNAGSDNGALEYLIVGGGGSGGRRLSGGGGAGGLIESQTSMGTGTYAVQVGSGGQAAINEQVGFNGGQSMFGTAVAVGGGGGGGYNGSAYVAGAAGGSGGGGGASSMAGGSGTTNQGFVGGSGQIVSWSGDSGYAGGGGGGAMAAGTNALGGGPSVGRPGAGGAGKASSITGTLQYYAGGGGGHQYRNTDTIAAGGSGVGGNGGIIYTGGSSGTAPTSGAANTGSGGGGGGFYNYENSSSGAGGSGIVVVRYPIGPPVPVPYMTATGGVVQTYTSTITRTNMVVNPSFEVDLFGWTGSQSDATISRITSDSYTGTSCLKMETSSSYQAVGSPAGPSSIYTVLPSTIYTFSVWAKTTSGSSIVVGINEYTSSGGYTGAGLSSSVTQLDGAWKRVSVTLTTGNATGKVQLAVFCSSPGSHTTYLDSFLFEQSSSVKDYFDGSSASSSWSGTPNASSSTYSNSVTYKSHTFLSINNVSTDYTFSVSELGESSFGSMIDYLIVAGGGAGGDSGAGGGAGGVLVGSLEISPQSYSIKVGAGGIAQYETGNAGNSGSSSFIGSIVASGGGGGGGYNSGQNSGLNGGSGGGAAANSGQGIIGTPGSGMAGQGFAGGTAGIDQYGQASNAGGGGATGSGYLGQYWYYSPEYGGFWVTAKIGGPGITNSFRTGLSAKYAGGGMPVSQESIPSSEWGGGGTAGAPNYNGYAGTDGTGSGGGSGYGYPGRGGSGIVVIRYRIA